MANMYADSSVIVKKYIPEIGSGWVRQILSPTAGNIISTAWISVVEVYSALSRRVREDTLNVSYYTRIWQNLRQVVYTQFQMIELTIDLIDQSRMLLENTC